MKRHSLTQQHLQKLKQYGLSYIPEQVCQYVVFSPGELLVREGEPISHFYIVISGRAKVCCNAPDGNSLILCWYVSDGVIGEVGLMAGRCAATTTVAAISEFSCIAIEHGFCMEEVKRNLIFSNALGKEMAKKLIVRTNDFSAQAFYTGEQRVCSYILEAAYRNVFNDVLTDVAGSVGISYRHLLRILKQLCTDGVLERREIGYCILDMDALKQRACHSEKKSREERA